MSKFQTQVENTLAVSGLAVLDNQVLHDLNSWQWRSRQAAMLDGLHPVRMAHALIALAPTLLFVECDLAGRRVLVACRTLARIEDRLEELTGHRPTAIKQVQPATANFIENTRIPEAKQPVVPEFPDDWDPAAYEASMPRHDCPRRTQMLAKLRRWHELHPAVA